MNPSPQWHSINLILAASPAVTLRTCRSHRRTKLSFPAQQLLTLKKKIRLVFLTTSHTGNGVAVRVLVKALSIHDCSITWIYSYASDMSGTDKFSLCFDDLFKNTYYIRNGTMFSPRASSSKTAAPSSLTVPDAVAAHELVLPLRSLPFLLHFSLPIRPSALHPTLYVLPTSHLPQEQASASPWLPQSKLPYFLAMTLTRPKCYCSPLINAITLWKKWASNCSRGRR